MGLLNGSNLAVVMAFASLGAGFSSIVEEAFIISCLVSLHQLMGPRNVNLY